MNNFNEKIVPVADFNWDEFENGVSVSANSREEQASAYEGTLSNIKENETTVGKVVKIGKREVIVNVGFKSEAAISATEFRYNKELKVGDEVEVFVESQEDKKGQLILSHRKARAARSWDLIQEAHQKDEVVTGYVKCRTKGGMIVDIFGTEAFLPGSQIDVRPIRDYDAYIDKTMEFKIVKINHEHRNAVVSHKILIEAELDAHKTEIISKLEKGQVLEGTVKNITHYGAFVDLGGIDGLIHITDLSWGRVDHPSEVVQIDQKIRVAILEFNEESKRIALGLKQLTQHPWEALDEQLTVGSKIKGKVVVVTEYGAFVEVAPGIEGLVHVSEMSWTQHLRSAREYIRVGDEIEAIILSLDRTDHKMSLGIKQLTEDPWAGIEERFPVGSRHTGRVRNFTNFGIFVVLEEGVEGLVHISDLSWTKRYQTPSEFTKVGADLEIQVLEIDKENRRLSLGHKQCEDNPWDVFETIFQVGTLHIGTVTDHLEKGAIIALPYGAEGFATPKHLIKQDGTTAAKGEELEFKVIEFSKANRRIIVSHSRVFEDVQRAERRAERAEAKAAQAANAASTPAINATEKATLGDLDVLAALKEKLS